MLSVGWTLNYEMFFYGCIWLALIIKRRFYIPITFGFILGSFILSGIRPSNNAILIFFHNGIVFEFIYGIILYKIYNVFRLFEIDNMLFVIFVILWVLALVFLVYIELMNFSTHRAIKFGLPSFIFVFSGLCMEGFLTRNRNFIIDIFRSIGDASYATYLTHYFVISGFNRVLGLNIRFIYNNVFISISFIIIVVLILGQFLYFFVDKPASRYFRKLCISK